MTQETCKERGVPSGEIHIKLKQKMASEQSKKMKMKNCYYTSTPVFAHRLDFDPFGIIDYMFNFSEQQANTFFFKSQVHS